MTDTTHPLPAWMLSAMTTACYVCAEVKAGRNKRAQMELWDRRGLADHLRIWLRDSLDIQDFCTECNRPMCAIHRRRVEHNLVNLGLAHHRPCRECWALRYRFSGGHSEHEMPFRRRWHLFRWRVTKRRLVDRMRISRVVEKVLCKDVADLVATYAVK